LPWMTTTYVDFVMDLLGRIPELVRG